MKRIAAMALGAAVALVLAACGSSGGSSGAEGSGSGATSASAGSTAASGSGAQQSGSQQSGHQQGSGQGQPANPKAVIQIGSLYNPTTLNYLDTSSQGVTQALSGNVYESLFKLTDDGDVKPLLATSYQVSDDGTTVTIGLRKGVKFHDGGTMTAKDVKASIQAILGPKSLSAHKSDLSVIKKVATPDAQTVVLTLTEASYPLRTNLTYVYIKPADFTPSANKEDGTGPYTVANYQPGESLKLEPFKGYWGDKPTNGGAVFHYYTQATAMNNALQSGSIDIVTNEQSPDALPKFKDESKFKINNGFSTTKEILAFNDRVKPFNKVKVRKAVTSAINNKQLLHSIWGSYGSLIGSMAVPTYPWYEDLTGVNPYNPTLAKKLLKQAGYPDGFSFTLDTPNYSPHPTVATFIKAQLAQVGITVKINIITSNQWTTKVYKNHDFTATLQEHVNFHDMVWYGNPDFYWGYDNPQVTKWIDDAKHATSTEQHTKLMKKVAKKIAEDAASDWLYLYPQLVVAKKDLSGYGVNGLNSQFYVYNITKS